MPLKSYTIIHNDAKLTNSVVEELGVWVNELKREIENLK